MRLIITLVLCCAVGSGRAQMMPMGLTSKSTLLQIPEIQRELRLTKAKLAELDLVRDTGVSQPDPSGVNDMQNPYRSVDCKLVPLLDAGQRKRLHQLFLQENGLLALSEPEVADELGLKEGVKRDALEVIDRLMFQVMDHVSDIKEGERFDEGLIEDYKASAQRRLEAMLSVEERQRWSAMKGKPFRFPNSMRRKL